MASSSESRTGQMTKVTTYGAIVNLLLSAAKMTAGLWGNSAAMVADAVHSLSDLISDAVVLIMVRISGKGTDKGHDFGHGKFETLATLIVAILLFIVGIKLLLSSSEKIRFVLEGGVIEQPGMIALGAAIVSIVAKEWLYQWTVFVGKRVKSPALIANAWHHRTDALSSIAALVGIGAAIIGRGKWIVLDPVVGALISIFVISIAVKITIPAIRELTEASLSEKIEQQIEQIVLAVPGVDNVHELKTRQSGPYIIIALHIVVDPLMTVREAHDITSKAENELRYKFGPETQISIHVEPEENAE